MPSSNQIKCYNYTLFMLLGYTEKSFNTHTFAHIQIIKN